MKVGVTGHQRLTDESAWDWVRASINGEVESSRPSVALSSLAIGADQLFADVALQHRVPLKAILPFDGYERTFKDGLALERYAQLLKQAFEVVVMPPQDDDETAYLEAGRRIVQESDYLIAVWDGGSAKGKGGTGDAVSLAKEEGKRVLHIDPYSRTTVRI